MYTGAPSTAVAIHRHVFESPFKSFERKSRAGITYSYNMIPWTKMVKGENKMIPVLVIRNPR